MLGTAAAEVIQYGNLVFQARSIIHGTTFLSTLSKKGYDTASPWLDVSNSFLSILNVMGIVEGSLTALSGVSARRLTSKAKLNQHSWSLGGKALFFRGPWNIAKGSTLTTLSAFHTPALGYAIASTMDLIEIIMNGINCTPPLHPYGDEHPEDDKPLNKDGSVINPYSSDSSEDIGQIRFEDLKTTLEEDEDLHPNLNTKNTKSTGYQFFAKLIEAAGWWFMFTVSLTGNPIFLTISAGCLGIAGFHKAFGKNQAVRTLLQDWINWSWENGNNKPSSGDIEITFFDLPTNQIAILRRGRI